MKVHNKEADRLQFIIPQPATGVSRNKAAESTGTGNDRSSTQVRQSFGEVLSAEYKKSEEVKLSAHAERRLRERNVVLNHEDMRKIEGAVQKAAAKGSRESLVIYGDLALVASVSNKTIITALEGKDMRDHVFTNIDSAVFVK
ncbi:MAG: TIGR02530 family flagellar biosynthesis protein [Bacillota bacterium]